MSFCPVVLVFGTSWLVPHLDLRTQAQVHNIIGCYDISRTSIYLICKAFIGSYTSSDITWMLSSRRCFDFTRCKYNDIKIISKLQNYLIVNVKIKRIVLGIKYSTVLDDLNIEFWNVMTYAQQQYKVHIFWEGHKILRNLQLTFDWHYIGQK